MSQEKSFAVDLRSAQQGDGDAWRRLYHRYRPALESWAGSFRANGEMSEGDLIQEAWIKVFKGIGGFNGVETDRTDELAQVFFQWLRVTCRHAMLTRIKYSQAARRHPRNPSPSNEEFELADTQIKTPSSIVESVEQAERLRKAIEELPDNIDRQIISMSFEDNLSLRAIANILNTEYTAIRRRFHFLLGCLGSTLSDNRNHLEKDK